MNHDLKTGLYRLHNPKMDWDVAHLYEHLLIRSFHRFIEANGYSPYLYGWVSGETFQDVLFLEYGFYSPAVEELFVKFMRSTPRVDFGLIENEVRRCESEARSLLEAKSEGALTAALRALDHQPFVDVETEEHIVQTEGAKGRSEVLKEVSSEESFRQVAVVVGMSSVSSEDKALFLRLTPIIIDAINNRLFGQGMYEEEVSWPVHNKSHDSMLVHAIYTIRKGTLADDKINILARQALADVELKGHERELEYYAKGFATTSTWNSFPIDYYRHTGLLVSRVCIAKLLTPENVQRVMSRLEVQVTYPTADHYDVAKH